MSPGGLTSLRKLLLDPAAFFEKREPRETLAIASGMVVLCTVVTFIALFSLPTILGGAIEGPITVDNPDRPPEWVCEDNGSSSEVLDRDSDACDEPAEIERSPEGVLQEAISSYYGILLGGVLLLWGLGSVSFFLMARMLGGTPSFTGTVALAGWAALPELFRVPVALLAIQWAVSDVTITDPDAEIEVLIDAITSIEPLLIVVTLLTAAWQWYLVTGGLQHDADLSRAAAGVAAGIPLALSVIFAAA